MVSSVYGVVEYGSVRGIAPVFVPGIIFFLLGIRSSKRRKSYPTKLKLWEESYPSRLKSWEEANETYQRQLSAGEKAHSEAEKKRADALEKVKSLV